MRRHAAVLEPESTQSGSRQESEPTHRDEWRKRFFDESGQPLPPSYKQIDMATGEIVQQQAR